MGQEKLTIVIIITHDNLLNLAELTHLAPEILIEGVEVVLQLAGVHFVFGVVGRVLVQVGQQDGLAVGRLDMFARAAVAVAAGADLVVEGAVDLVGLRAEDAGEVVRHDRVNRKGERESGSRLCRNGCQGGTDLAGRCFRLLNS